MAEMTEQVLRALCKEHDLYTTPAANDKLYASHKVRAAASDLGNYVFWLISSSNWRTSGGKAKHCDMSADIRCLRSVAHIHLIRSMCTLLTGLCGAGRPGGVHGPEGAVSGLQRLRQSGGAATHAAPQMLVRAPQQMSSNLACDSMITSRIGPLQCQPRFHVQAMQPESTF